MSLYQEDIKKHNSILVLSPELTSWTLLKTAPVKLFSLSTYKSKLVMVGGREIAAPGNPTNRLSWSNDGGNWHPLLPPMLTNRYLPAVINTISPEYLVVAGGMIEVGSSSYWYHTGSFGGILCMYVRSIRAFSKLRSYVDWDDCEYGHL